MNTTLTIAAVHEAAHALVAWKLGGRVLSVSMTDRECVRMEPAPTSREKLVHGLAVRLAAVAWYSMAAGGVPDEPGDFGGDLVRARQFGERYFADRGRPVDEEALGDAVEEAFQQALRIVQEYEADIWSLGELVQRVGRLPGPNCERFLRGLRRLRTHDHEPAGRTAGDVDRARAGVA